MPSDAKKKQQQKKKEAAKARQSGKKPPQNNQNKGVEDGKESSPGVGVIQNGTNGTPISAEGKIEDKDEVLKSLLFINYISNSLKLYLL